MNTLAKCCAVLSTVVGILALGLLFWGGRQNPHFRKHHWPQVLPRFLHWRRL
jgi:hypothetical protein